MVKFKSDPMSSPDTPPIRGVVKRFHRFRERRSRSPIEPVFPENTPGGVCGPSFYLPNFDWFTLSFHRTELRHSRNEAILNPTALIARMKLERLRPVMNPPKLLAEARVLTPVSTKVIPTAML